MEQTIENPQKSVKTNKKFSKVARYGNKIQKSFVCLYLKDEQSKREIKETIIFTIASQITKFLGIS